MLGKTLSQTSPDEQNRAKRQWSDSNIRIPFQQRRLNQKDHYQIYVSSGVFGFDICMTAWGILECKCQIQREGREARAISKPIVANRQGGRWRPTVIPTNGFTTS